MTPADINTCTHEWWDGLELGIVDIKGKGTALAGLGGAFGFGGGLPDMYQVQACKKCLVLRLKPKESA